MPRMILPDAPVTDARFGIVVSRYNASVTERLLDGAIATLRGQHVPDHQMDVAWVPGAWEIPIAAQTMAETRRYQALICLGAVIQGETTHDEHINRQVSMSLGQIALQFRLPVAFGVLTCRTEQQAVDRSGGAMGNKGVECAEAALEMVRLLRGMEKAPAPPA